MLLPVAIAVDWCDLACFDVTFCDFACLFITAVNFFNKAASRLAAAFAFLFHSVLELLRVLHQMLL